MPAYEWTCGECGAKLRGLGTYEPGPARAVCKQIIARSPDSKYDPMIMSNRCLFSDPKLIDIDEV
jgi:hypothetical protein